MRNRVVLLGCTGEIGSRLTMTLIGSGFEVFGVRASRECKIKSPLHTCLQRNLLSSELDLNLQNIKPEILIHTAWHTTPNLFWESESNSKWSEASQRIILDFENSGGKYLVVTGSCAEYSWELGEPLSETSLELPVTAYGKARLELLKWLRNKELPFLWTRTFFQFGLNEPEGRLIPSLIDSLLEGRPYMIRSGKDIRDFVYVEDVVRILSYLISKKYTGVINIGSGVGSEIETASRKLANLIGRDDLIGFKNDNKEKSIVVSNPEKLISIIGNYPWKPFETALLESIKARNIFGSKTSK